THPSAPTTAAHRRQNALAKLSLPLRPVFATPPFPSLSPQHRSAPATSAASAASAVSAVLFSSAASAASPARFAAASVRTRLREVENLRAQIASHPALTGLIEIVKNGLVSKIKDMFVNLALIGRYHTMRTQLEAEPYL
ncbi:hypothetical protein KEM56_001960, partial [Ascosphaera pollenicola]